MSEPIEPALTAEDWADVRKYGVSWVRAEAGPVHWGDWSDQEDAEVMAIANYALPDDSPYKITREDVAFLRVRAENCWATERHAVEIFRTDVADDARRAAMYFDKLAAKLAALLPPETP